MSAPIGDSGPGDNRPPGHPPPPPPPPPTGPPFSADALFAAVDEILADWSFEPPRRKPWRSFDEQGRPS